MVEPERADRDERQFQQARINRVLGIFLLFFGAVVLIAMAFTPTLVGKLTNLTAGAIIGLLGGAMVYSSRRRR